MWRLWLRTMQCHVKSCGCYFLTKGFFHHLLLLLLLLSWSLLLKNSSDTFTCGVVLLLMTPLRICCDIASLTLELHEFSVTFHDWLKTPQLSRPRKDKLWIISVIGLLFSFMQRYFHALPVCVSGQTWWRRPVQWWLLLLWSSLFIIMVENIVREKINKIQ